MESSVHLFARYVNCRRSRVSGSVVMSVLVNCSTLQHSIHSGSGLANFMGQRQCRILSDMVGWRDKPILTHGYTTTDALRFSSPAWVNSLENSLHICPVITSGQGTGISHPDVTLSTLTLLIAPRRAYLALPVLLQILWADGGSWGFKYKSDFAVNQIYVTNGFADATNPPFG